MREFRQDPPEPRRDDEQMECFVCHETVGESRIEWVEGEPVCEGCREEFWRALHPEDHVQLPQGVEE